MTKGLWLTVALAFAAPMTVVPAHAQGAAQTVIQYKVDIANVAVGYRASKVIGATVINDAGDKIGALDDLIVTRSDRILYAIVSVGGFLGMGDKLVAIPFTNLQFVNDKIELPGGSKEFLKGLPTFTYAK